ncbi:acyl-CoA dehydrogenase family protein [Amycolatopsis minnesotensis]|uniref:Acyl-CoA dehydrogenase family protein n=1 Tax=Amycolatopsis minnesotensis TaxID=337894 RepID=A0ABN2RAU0_9PSEU
MDFTLDETQREIADLATGILRKELDHERTWHDAGYDTRTWRALADAGLFSLALPADLGGDGLGVTEISVLLAEIGRAAAPVPALAALAYGVLPLDALGSPRQRAAFLPGVAAGETLLTAALHEPSAPLTLKPRTRAESDGGTWRLTGTKIGVPFAAAAERILVPASTPTGTAVFLVDPAAEGMALTPAPSSSGLPESSIHLDGVRVSDEDALDDHAPGEALATVRRFALAGVVSLADGVLAGALDLTSAHVGTRHQFGRPLAAFQAVAQQVADVYIISRTLQLAARSSAWRLGSGLDADGDLGVAAYWLAHEAPAALGTCHHLHGGLGVDVTYPLHRYYSLTKDLVRAVGGSASTESGVASCTSN